MSWTWIAGGIGALIALFVSYFKGHAAGVRKGTAETLDVALKSRREEMARDVKLREQTEAIENEVQAKQLDPPSLPSEADLDALHEEVKKL